MQKPSLPIDVYLNQICTTITREPLVFLKAPPGTGKTTRLPPKLLETLKNKILVLEPRRLAAKLAAQRVANEYGEKLGDRIGFQTRFENEQSAATKLLYLTEGLFPKLVMNDPTLSNISAVVFDEFHERHLATDLAFAYAYSIQKSVRPDLKIILMSATFDPKTFGTLCTENNLLDVPAVHFSIKNHYLANPKELPLVKHIDIALEKSLGEIDHTGDTLVFLPGYAEIKECQEYFGEHMKDFLSLELRADTPQNLSAQVFAPSTKRKLIFSTNVAESSVTIPNVTCVIDSGLEKRAFFDPTSGIVQLRTGKISKQSALQRRGRAGRTKPGVAVALYGEHEFNQMQEFFPPEILNADLSQAVLENKFVAEKSANLTAGKLSWLNQPNAGAIAAAENLLNLLELTDDRLTPQGRLAAQLPLHPRLATAIIHGYKCPDFENLLNVVLTLNEGRMVSKGEAIDVETLPKFFNQELRHRINHLLTKSTLDFPEGKPLDLALFMGFQDRLCRTLDDKQRFKTLACASGGHFLLPTSEHFAKGSYVVALASEMKKTQKTAETFVSAYIRLSDIDTACILSKLYKSEVITKWDEQKQSARTLSIESFGELYIAEGSRPLDTKAAEACLLKKLQEVFPKPFEIKNHFSDIDFRFELLKKHDLVPASTKLLSEMKDEFLKFIATEKSSFTQVLEHPVEYYIPQFLDEKIINAMQRNIPDEWRINPKRVFKINYETGKNPWIEAPIQMFYGVSDGVTILNGKVPVTIHLLGPHKRALQVTADLKSFWKNSYPKLRQEYLRIYPRHNWPENPETAQPILLKREIK